MPELVITNATWEEMDFFIALAKEEGWNPGLHDALPFYHTDPHGFFVGKIDNQIVGSISAAAYDQTYGFLGFYYVIPSMRNQGYGQLLGSHAFRYLGTRSMGLDGVLQKVKSYEALGFHVHYRNQRFEGMAGGSVPQGLISVNEVPFNLLLDYDIPVFGLPRKSFLENWLKMPNAYALAKVEKERLVGYGVLRTCYRGHKIGPLFADSFDVADEIYQGLSAKAEKGPVFLDVPLINEQAMKLVEKNRLKLEFETMRMYNKTPPKQNLQKVFGITSFELG